MTASRIHKHIEFHFSAIVAKGNRDENFVVDDIDSCNFVKRVDLGLDLQGIVIEWNVSIGKKDFSLLMLATLSASNL